MCLLSAEWEQAPAGTGPEVDTQSQETLVQGGSEAEHRENALKIAEQKGSAHPGGQDLLGNKNSEAVWLQGISQPL